MQQIKMIFRRAVMGLPVLAVIGASLLPMRMWAQQALMFFILIWFYVFMIFDVFGK